MYQDEIVLGVGMVLLVEVEVEDGRSVTTEKEIHGLHTQLMDGLCAIIYFPKDFVHLGFVSSSLTTAGVSNYALKSNEFPF